VTQGKCLESKIFFTTRGPKFVEPRNAEQFETLNTPYKSVYCDVIAAAGVAAIVPNVTVRCVNVKCYHKSMFHRIFTF